MEALSFYWDANETVTEKLLAWPKKQINKQTKKPTKTMARYL